MAKLGGYIEQIRGVSYKPEDVCSSTDNDAVAILRANNIQDDGLHFDDLVYVKKNKISDRQYIKKGDIIVCASSGSKSLVGKAAIASENFPVAFGAFCKVVRPKKLIPSYTGYFFQSPKYRSTISELSGGANINNIRNEHIDELDIVIVSEKEQESIVNQLDALSNLIFLRKQQLSKLDELVKSRFIELFGKCKEQKRLEEYAPLITKGASPKWQGVDYCEEGTLFVTSENVREGYLDLSKRKYLDDKINEIQPRSILKRNDILINIVGASIGRAAVYDCDEAANINQAVALVRVDYSQINQTYLMTFLNSPQAIEMYGKMKKGGARDNLSLQNIADLQIPIAPIELQKQFAAFVEQTDKSKLAIQKSLEKLETLKKALMQQYFG